MNHPSLYRLCLCVGVVAGMGLVVSLSAEPSRVQQFAVMGYEGIQKDLAAGDGVYLRSLLELLKVPGEHRAQTIQKIHLIAKAEPNILTFSEAVDSLQFRIDPAVPSVVPSAHVPTQLLPAKHSLYQGDALRPALEHLTRGMPITVFLKSGETVSAKVVEYANQRLRLRGSGNMNIRLADIQAIEAPGL